MENKDKISEMIKLAYEHKDHACTWWHTLEESNGKKWAVVVSWMDYDRNDDWRLYAKVAYQSTNSLMQEYDVDWLMPGDDNGLWTDELQVSNSSADSDAEWLLKEWEYIKEKGDI